MTVVTDAGPYDAADRASATTPLSEVFTRLIKKADPEGLHTGQVGGYALQQLWEQVAGQPVANVTKKLVLRDKELFVIVDNQIWAQELNLLAEEYRKRLNEASKELSLERIVFRVKVYER